MARTAEAHVLIVGMGSLGRMLAVGLAACPEVARLTLASRSEGRGQVVAALAAACGQARVRFEQLDATDAAAVEGLLRRDRYELIVQAGGLLAPWALEGRSDLMARAVGEAGFALRLCAQIPIMMAVMEAARQVGFAGPVVNCSFPDLVNVVLARQGLAPTAGIGNVGMILYRARAALRERLAPQGGQPLPLVRVLAHHSQVDAAMRSKPEQGQERPQVYLGDEGARADELAYAGYPLPIGEERNLLTAASALPALRALLPGAEPVRTSLPGPLGLPGGYPVIVEEGTIRLDLPAGLDEEAAVAFNWRCMRCDGVEAVGADGTVVLAKQAQRALAGIAPELPEPLHPRDALARFKLLERRLNEATGNGQ